MISRTFKMKALQAGMVMALAAGTWATAQAATLNVSSLSITGGGFNMGAPVGGSGTVALTGGSAAPLVAGTYQGGAVDSATGGTYGTTNTLTNFSFFGTPVYTYTAAQENQCVPGSTCTTSGNGLIPGGPYAAPTGTVDTTAGTITMNLPSWVASWNGTDFNQGTNNGSTSSSTVATGTYNASTGAYVVDWHSFITGGSFNGQTGYWQLSGNVTTAAVPEASTAAMMLVGLTLVGGVATRRRKLS